MNVKQKGLTIVWAFIVIALTTICALEYNLAYNLKSVYDERFFYVTSVLAHQPIADTQPLTLAQDAINSLVPNIEQYDVLALRQYAFGAKSIEFIFLILLCLAISITLAFLKQKIGIYKLMKYITDKL